MVAQLPRGSLRTRLEACLAAPPRVGARTIGHRGAPLRYPEHTRESYIAAARLGAATLECDVTFTRDHTLVCRHSQCDLHSTTNILSTPLASRCSEPFTPARFDDNGELIEPAAARCCTSDLTEAEFLSLTGRRDAVNAHATNVSHYLDATPATGLPACLEHGTLMTHQASIGLFSELGVAMAPELKTPAVNMPFKGLGRTEYADRLLDAYREAGIEPDRVWVQSFDLQDIRHWLAEAPDFASRVVWLDGRSEDPGFDHRDLASLAPGFGAMSAAGLRFIAPPLWMLVEASDEGLKPSAYARAAREAGLDLVAWTFERSGSLAQGGGWYYQTLNGDRPGDAGARAFRVRNDGDQLQVLDSLFNDVGVVAVFSDWAATAALVDSCSPTRE